MKDTDTALVHALYKAINTGSDLSQCFSRACEEMNVPLQDSAEQRAKLNIKSREMNNWPPPKRTAAYAKLLIKLIDTDNQEVPNVNVKRDKRS